MKKAVIYIVVLASLGIACSPMLQKPHTTTPQEWSYGEGFSTDSTRMSQKWWEIFSDSTLNSLMERAIANNRDLKSTFTNISAAKSQLKIARAEFLPKLSLDAEFEGYRINGTTTKEYSVTPTLEWEVSLFGAMKNSKKSAAAEYLATQWGYRSAMLSLTSQVATTLFTLLRYERSYDIALRSYELRREATALVDSMHRYGMSDGIALEQARSLVYSAEAEVFKYRRAIVQTRLALNLLLGDTPQTEFSTQGLSIKIPQIPVALPSQVLERRPDVMQSLYTMESCAAKVGVARADRFPSISLTGEGGFISYTLKNLSSAKPFGWSFTGALTQPIFEFGALKHREEIARQEYISSMYAYEQATLQALSDVEQALIYIATYSKQLSSSASLVSANAKIELTTSALYKSGMGDYLSVIDAERELFTSQIDYQALLCEQYINYVGLVKALGGGF